MKSDTKSKEESIKILRYARHKFHKEGFYKTTMDELSSEMHISKKTIYKYFPSKEKLLEEICNDTSGEIMKNMNVIVDGGGDVVVKFVKMLDMHSNISINISEKWIKDLSVYAPDFKKRIDETRNAEINKVLKKLLDQGKKESLIENYPSPIIIICFISSLMSVMNPEFLVNNKFSIHEAFKITYEMLLNGILTEKGKEKFKKAKTHLARELNREVLN
ncbi:MAG: TetR/AcrR family transcriptional regulator [Ignavibacteria bacterium]|nr:TetR/AcrR family transcriptional regulator [Ignavibacteria bacterium]